MYMSSNLVQSLPVVEAKRSNIHNNMDEIIPQPENTHSRKGLITDAEDTMRPLIGESSHPGR